MKIHFVYAVFCLLIINIVSAQETNISKLKIEDIMKGDDFIGHRPSNVFWGTDHSSIYFDWNPDMAFSDSLYRYDLNKNDIKKVDYLDAIALPSNRRIDHPSQDKAVYSNNGDIFILDKSTSKILAITNTKERESNPHFTDDGKKVAFVNGENIYTWDLANGTLEQITDFVEKIGEEPKRSNKDEWLYQDQLELFGVLRERKEKKDLGESISKKMDDLEPLPLEIGGKQVINQTVSPNGRFVTYVLMDMPKNKRTMVPHFVTESGYTEEQTTRTKVGDELPTYEMFVYDTKAHTNYPVVLDSLEGLNDVPEFMKDYPDKTYENKNPIGRIGSPTWHPNGNKAILDIQASNYKNRWIVLLDAKTGTITQLDRQHDEAWIAGPGITGWFNGGDLGWMPDGKSIWYKSEKTGYAHLYTMDMDGKNKKTLTSGDFEIYDPFISKDKKRWYFTANKNHPGDRQFYTMPLKGGKMQQLTQWEGRNDVTLSPDEKQMAILYSYSNKPTELYVQKNPVYGKSGDPVKITESNTEAFNAYSWKDPEIITFSAADGANVHARLYTPDKDVKNNAAVIFVHGAGYLQNAHKWWSSYYREYMFHNLLVDNGYTVLDIDYRGSAGYGRDWRTGIYRHMGGKDLSDQVDGAKYLVENYGVDSNKIGIYGGSYGGFITLMGMFNAPETFSAGAAIRSVGDWAAYNHGYTAHILNTPVQDSLAYKRSSPIYFAEGLEGQLLILHGMVDDNVHFQDMVRLSQRLIELGKENWEMAVYPVERHGFVEPSSWTDEYKRIFKLFEETLTD
ncbi:S9 family peptidase [Maribacter cobaltidurans]|uniref:S9 family peptidase n=1 Tax=Maribacter cobaltidurans TaxID=1178778 RepID=A0A223V5L0_9FLAO|nr:prolyl oligopeptidase family serine peptidase [Maribacter cobaltidurans]ASV30129.1 S9 family peptidase [Maribacter cobaltidurans]GGD76015.1 peptidase S9 [Maribacter cobaltidurans]